MTTLTEQDYKAAVKEMLSTLRVLQVGKVIVSFAGSGDSGSINDINCDNETIDLKDHLVRSVTKSSSYVNGQWVEHYKEELVPLYNALENFTYEELEHTGIDWYNNDGGQGSLEIDFDGDNPRVDLNVEVNITEVQSNNFDLAYSFGLTEEPKETAED